MNVVKAPDGESTGTDAVLLEIITSDQSKQVTLLGGRGLNPSFKTIELGGLSIGLTYGSRIYELPFSITLNDFIADKYPGTQKAYSAFKSKVTVNDRSNF